MATYQRTIRRGLPRVAGGEPWPSVIPSIEQAERVETVPAQDAPVPLIEQAEQVEITDTQDGIAAVAPAVGPAVTLRRGLPRVAGGEPWPNATPSIEQAERVETTDTQDAPAPAVPTPPIERVERVEIKPADATVPAAPPSTQQGVAVETVSEEVPLRRGLPRVAGGDPWPIAETATVQRVVAASPPVIPEEAASVSPVVPRESAAVAPDGVGEAPAATPAATEPAAASAPAAQTPATPATPAKPAKPVREPRMIGSRPLTQWVKWGVWGVIGAIIAAGVVVLAARGVTTLPGVPEFVEKYPGEYRIPDVAEPGFPAWARWTHFLNIFLMVLIIRSGLQVRQQQKPPAFWTPKKGGKKISINLWLHTSLDLLWMLNGVVFIVLLFVSGHWARIVPTSWEVFPNAASALLQYLTLDWPTENGWVNYNSLQQLMYFLVVFVAAPLAILTGVRMSEWWPGKAEKLNKIYPAPVARAIHFPTMLFFVLFILIHVFLVLSTGALRNLNHMFAGSDALNWVGFWWFAGGIFVTVAAVFLARPLILAPIASLTGKVSNR
ncbi:cytochrome b/b6 domain-containing protein [Leucobacter insecticola]|uniref:Cytochrome b/b6 domain-containing protein n=1 Tax=Leucobacter insecticola TaxID=2714934 RepID=A0A6G8FGR7_9MICO|nr:cytochrome b/b6 domain-containing protein [Leucobacter insecticola]QIM15222.1 cytochrome b/b6 domain-containing protein [Leucobacter insecticola]